MRNQYCYSTVATTPTNPFFPNYRLASTEDPKKQLWMDGVLKLFFYTPFKRRLHLKPARPPTQFRVARWQYALSSPPHPKLVIKSDHKSYNKTRKRVIWLEMTAINLENCWEITLLHTLPKKEIELKWVYFFSKSSQFMRRTGKKEGELKALLSLCKTWIKSFLGVDDAVTTPCKNLEL